MTSGEVENHVARSEIAVLTAQYEASQKTTLARLDAIHSKVTAMTERLTDIETTQKIQKVGLDAWSKVLIALCPIAVGVVTWLLNHTK